MFFSILMFGQPGAEIMYPDPGFPDLPLDDRVHRRQAGADRAEGGERVRLHRRPGAVADHAQDQPHHPQQPRQPLRRRRAGRGGEAAGGGAGEASQRRRHVGRDLQPDALRRPQARELPALSRDPRPADPARRLVQDLRHDRLAARLLGVAEGAGGAGRAARASTATPASTRRRSTPASPRSKARRTRCTRWWRPSTSAAA